MNDELLDRLFERAREDRAPEVDVRLRVLSALRPAGPAPHVVFWMAAAASSLAAAVIGLAAFQTVLEFADPLRDLFTPFLMVMR